jgi:hypothetical protein
MRPCQKKLLSSSTLSTRTNSIWSAPPVVCLLRLCAAPFHSDQSFSLVRLARVSRLMFVSLQMQQQQQAYGIDVGAGACCFVSRRLPAHALYAFDYYPAILLTCCVRSGVRALLEPTGALCACVQDTANPTCSSKCSCRSNSVGACSLFRRSVFSLAGLFARG